MTLGWRGWGFGIQGSLLATHRPGRNHADQIATHGEDHRESPIRRRTAQHEVARLSSGVLGILGQQHRLMKKDFLGFVPRDRMTSPVLLRIPAIPVKAGQSGREGGKVGYPESTC